MIYKNYRLVHCYGGYNTKVWLIYFGYTYQATRITLEDARKWCRENPLPSFNF